MKQIEQQFYNMGFNDAENFAELVMFENKKYRFGEGWMAALQAMGVPDDFPLRNPEQIPFPEPPPPI